MLLYDNKTHQRSGIKQAWCKQIYIFCIVNNKKLTFIYMQKNYNKNNTIKKKLKHIYGQRNYD